MYKDWTKEEYAHLTWENLKEFINQLDSKNIWNDRDKCFQIIGFMEGYLDNDKQYKFEYQI